MKKQTTFAVIAIIIAIPMLSVALLYSESSGAPILRDGPGITILTSFYPIYEFTKQVGGERLDVSLLVPYGVEPHDWEPTIKDVQKIESADAVIINGVGFENWIDQIIQINPNVRIVDTSKGITIMQSRDDPTSSDPHIWLNPVDAITQVENIANALSDIDPPNKFYYEENSKRYQDKLANLDKKIASQLTNCKTDFLAFHNAFSYFANQYGLTQHTIVDTNGPHGEPTPQALENIIKLSQRHEISVIFSEEGVDERTSQVLAHELGISVLTLSPIEIGDGESYIRKMEQNLSNLRMALCQG